MEAHLPRIMIAAAASGSGKTTLTCALLKALGKLGKRVASYKCGPDYIDPMFHTQVLGVPSSNLDLFLMGEKACKYLLRENAIDADIAVIEGVMGYYDGLGTQTLYSSYHLAKETDTPVVLVLGCKGMACTVGAILKGLTDFRQDSNIKGVILNQVSERMYPFYREIIEREAGIAVLGYLPELPDCYLKSRHLGLVTAQEMDDLEAKLDRLAETALKTVDIEAFLKLANEAPSFVYEEIEVERQFDVTIGVARDRAFCFYYQDALMLLEKLGARIVFFSPMRDEGLPECDGFILGGGYPELYLKELAQNRAFISDLQRKVQQGIPYLAECGGFLYLFEQMRDFDGEMHKMAGLMKGEAFLTEKLNRFGYVTLTANRDNLLCKMGEIIHAHEFHYADTTDNGRDFMASKPNGNRAWECIFADGQRFAGFPHIHFSGNIKLAENFLRHCQALKTDNSK